MGIEPFVVDTTMPDRDQLLQETAGAWGQKMQNILETLQGEMKRAQTLQETAANLHRDHAPRYKVGDQVFVDTRNMSSLRPNKKLDNKNEGPFKILKVVSPHAYQVEIPESWSHHDVFHTTLLRLAGEDPLPGQWPPYPLPRVNEAGDEEWDVDEIVDSRMYKGKLQFRTRWSGDPQMTWSDFVDVRDTLAVGNYFDINPRRIGWKTWEDYVKNGDDDQKDQDFEG
jgi:hypothetical protein